MYKVTRMCCENVGCCACNGILGRRRRPMRPPARIKIGVNMSKLEAEKLAASPLWFGLQPMVEAE